MNYWTKQSFDLANNFNYLDRLYKVYRITPNIRRNIDPEITCQISVMHANPMQFYRGDLLNIMLQLDIFPIKDSYVAYLRHDRSAIQRNPNTVDRIEGAILSMDIEEIFKEITKPIETNRQMGQLFRNWVDSPCFRCDKTDDEYKFMNTPGLIVFLGDDNKKKDIAQRYFGYTLDKGIDFLVKKGNNVALGEAKFLTDFGGHQNAQFSDAMNIHSVNAFIATQYNITPLSILDGVVYIENKNNKMTKEVKNLADSQIVISSLLLQNFIGVL